MKIPPFLEASYQQDHSLTAFVSASIGKIESHIASNRLEFFPEYTDHSVRHIELTLQTAFDLASAPARGLLTPADAAALCAAVGLHDLGMYLTKDGFFSLTAPESRWRGVGYFDRKDWSTLWEDFFAEATRFDDRKLRQLFGDNYRPVRPLPPKEAAWDDLDNLLVGEFLRRHHPRLAHEIAIYGLPGKDGSAIEICPSGTEEQRFLADIAGVIARSHGMDLRTCLEYLKDRYQNKINPRGVHAAFLGSLVRIADYFQIQAARAPSARTDVAAFKSQLSEREWNVHQSVRDIHNTSGDPEAIVVVAEPRDVQAFLRLKDWLDGLQNELDQSWAILGEVFGLQGHNNLNLLGMKIRRVSSNLDDVASFSRSVNYVPARIAFEAANADLLKLLVVPLYGNNPGIGLRELIQNSVDAVREFDDLALQHPELLKLDRFEQETDVKLEVKCDSKDLPIEITITDRGVGMTAEIIRDYFLKAGASFRKSSAWRSEHEDQEGRSRVFRTGRFGVGALAAYLLGDKIEVTIRHVHSAPNQGIKFFARIDDETISLDRTTCPVGTRISIAIPKQFQDTVKRIVPYQWAEKFFFGDPAGHYFLKSPSLSRHFTNRKELPVANWLPQAGDDASADWRFFTNADFERVFWTYSSQFPVLACNGIVIGSPDRNDRIRDYLKLPRLSVFDRDGRLPVNLQRTGLQGQLPFTNDLLTSIAEDVCAHAFVDAPADCEDPWFGGAYEGFAPHVENVYYPDWSRWLIGRDGFVLNEPSLLANFAPRTILVALGGGFGYNDYGASLRSALSEDTLLISGLPQILNDSNPRIKGLIRRAIEGSGERQKESKGLLGSSTSQKR